MPWLGWLTQWRREELRTNLWLVPTVEVVAAVGLFLGTVYLDRAAYRGGFRLPAWVIGGSADAARQFLTSIAASLITRCRTWPRSSGPVVPPSAADPAPGCRWRRRRL